MKSAEQVKEEAIKACETIIENILSNKEDLTELPNFWVSAIRMCEEKIKRIDIDNK